MIKSSPDQGLLRLGQYFLWGIALVGAARLLRLHQRGGNDWITGDWLINYAGGFIRRGLSGEVIMFLADITGVSDTLTTGVFLAVLWLCVCLLTLRIWTMSQANFGRLALLLSPAFLAFDLWDFQGGARKELAIFAVLAVMLGSKNLTARSSPAQWVWTCTFTALPPILILAHELIAFTIPLTIVAFLLMAQEAQLSLDKRIFFISGIAILSLISLLFVANFSGTLVQRDEVCSELTSRGAAHSLCSGAISWLGRSAEDAYSSVSLHASSPETLVFFALAAGMSTVPFLYFRGQKLVGSITPTMGLFIATLGLVPLFALGLDWGRWIHIGATICTLIVLRFPEIFSPRPFAQLGILREELGTRLLVVLIFGFGWSVDHFGGGNILPGFIRVLKSTAAGAFLPG